RPHLSRHRHLDRLPTAAPVVPYRRRREAGERSVVADRHDGGAKLTLTREVAAAVDVDAAVSAPQTPTLDPATHGRRRDPELHQTRELDHVVMLSSEPRHPQFLPTCGNKCRVAWERRGHGVRTSSPEPM